MAPERRRQIALAILLVVLGVVVYQVWPRTAEPVAAPSNRRTVRTAGQRGAAPGEVPDVRLESLDAQRPEPAVGRRNLFRFRAVPPPSMPPPGPVTIPPVRPPTGLPAVAAAPGIPLRFIGFVQEEGKGKVVALADERGTVFSGREGDIIEGRYRLRQIGVESIVLEHLDGRGRQTIPLSNR